MKIAVLGANGRFGDRFVANNPEIDGAEVVVSGARPEADFLNALIHQSADTYACVVRDDVYLPAGFAARAAGLIATLDDAFPNWGVCGNAGRVSYGLGYARTRAPRYLADAHQGPNYQGGLWPAQTVDGTTRLLNLAALRRAGVRLPPLASAPGRDVALSLECLVHHLGVLVAPQLAVFTASRAGAPDGAGLDGDAAAPDYLRSRVRNRIVETVHGRVDLTGPTAASPGAIDLVNESVRVAGLARPARRLAIVIRTQFQRPALLQRTVETAMAFAAAAGTGLEVAIHLVTDSAAPAPRDRPGTLSVLRVPALAAGRDSRAYLVTAAIERLEADFFWFLDDDDWVFPNRAAEVGGLLSTIPAESLVFLQTRQFDERLSADDSCIGGGYAGSERAVLPPDDWVTGLTGHNRIPMCGMMIGRAVLRRADLAGLRQQLYYEDFALELACLAVPGCHAVTFDALVAGISVRESGQTITQTAREPWYRSMATLVANQCAGAQTANLFAIGEALDQAAPAAPSPAPGRPEYGRAVGRVLRGVLRVALRADDRRKARAQLSRVWRAEGVKGVVRRAYARGRPPD